MLMKEMTEHITYSNIFSPSDDTLMFNCLFLKSLPPKNVPMLNRSKNYIVIRMMTQYAGESAGSCEQIV